MTALTADRNTVARSGDVSEFPVLAAVKIYAGALVALTAAGWARNGITATGLKAVGRAEEPADNTSGANGAINVKVRRGIFRFANSSAGDLIARQHVNDDCFIVDDQTVALTNGTSTRSRAGKIVDVDANGVWVDTRL